MSKRLLLADDSITIQKVIQITFAHEDYELTITDNGDAAYARARDLVPDLVLADVYMPGKNGYELCAAIKQDPALRQTPVLLLAGSFEPFDEGKARASGADAWIEKPFESQALIDKVASLLAATTAAPAPAPPQAPVAATVAAPVAPPADPFGDISFEEPAVAVAPFSAPPPVAAPDDWSDLAVTPAAPPVVPTPAPAPVEFAFAPAPAAPTPAAFEPSVATPADFDVFGETDEVMSLGEDDILGAEDLEPAGELPSLSPWSREVAPVEDTFEAFAEPAPLSFAPPIEPPPVPVAPSLAPVAPPVAPVIEAAPVAAPPVLPPVVPAPAVAPVVASPAAAAAVEQRVATLSEDEIERIVERAVGRVIEKLAGTLIEKVAWEVVPDLAEALIKEEIRKIKDAAA